MRTKPLIEVELHKLVSKHLRSTYMFPITNFILSFSADDGRQAFSLSIDRGRFNYNDGTDLQFRISSIAKMFVAIVVLQLEEEGVISGDETIGHLFTGKNFIDIPRIHVLHGQEHGDDININHLLYHRSGMADMFSDSLYRFYLYELFNRRKHWKPSDIIDWFFRKHLNKEPRFAPGEGFHYSNINYVLLGLIIQALTDDTLASQVRKRIFEPLSMTASACEDEMSGRPSIVDVRFSRARLSRSVDMSYDWGGGYAVSSGSDLLKFTQSLIDGSIFKYDDTRKRFTTVFPIPGAAGRLTGYGCGICKYLLNGEEYFGHHGNWGSLLVYSPERRVSLCITTNQAFTQFDIPEFAESVLSLVTDR